MTADPLTTNPLSDPIAAALADKAVNGRLLAVAQVFLRRSAPTFSRQERVADAEEVVSIAGVEVLKHRHQFDPTRDAVAWIVGFIQNATREFLRKKGRLPKGPPPAGPQLEELAADRGKPIEEIVADRDQLVRLMSCLNPDEQRMLQMKFEEDRTFGEIAKELGMKEDTVRVRAHRLLKRLRRASVKNAGEGQP